MNDELDGLEFKRALQLIIDNHDEPAKYSSLHNSIDWMSDGFLSCKYLFSASSLKDDISQWRAYTTLGQGICFGFNDEFISDGTIKKHACLYETKSKKSFILSNTKLLEFENIEFESKRMKDGSLSGLVDYLSDGIEFFKHESFSPEKETRWIDDLCSKGGEEVFFRPHRLGLIPYRSIPIDISKISTVIIGPQVPKQNISTLYKLLKFSETEQRIISSTVTLR